ncbi:hypothetical protein AMJ50_01800 [Parcubacteria bacterium DG_74_3]|nr:MAG: hypothetical protein AMJ50_01800 [Parcubacteria bacterium DG_74_3]
MERKKRTFIYLFFSFLLGANILAWLIVYDLFQKQFFQVIFFDVGQGDAIFIETGQGHQILIDGGPTSAILEKLGQEMPFYDRTLDLIVLTHPEHDHMAGLIEVLKRYKVEKILWTGVLRNTGEFKEWEKTIKEEQEKEKTQIHIAKAGQKISWSGRFPDQQVFYVLNPLESPEGQELENSNNTSIVLRLIFNGQSFLFTGDIYKSIEKKLLGKGIALGSNVLKIGHHGSKTSTSEDFLEGVLPEIAVISVGRGNSYGHPHAETLATLNKYDIKVLRTDLNGDIKMFSDGKTLNINIKNERH